MCASTWIICQQGVQIAAAIVSCSSGSQNDEASSDIAPQYRQKLDAQVAEIIYPIG